MAITCTITTKHMRHPKTTYEFRSVEEGLGEPGNKNDGSSPGTVNMKPAVVSLSNLTTRTDGIKGPQDGCPCCRIDEKGCVSQRDVFLNQSFYS